MFDFTVFIGRFQPFHNGHLHVVTEALKFSSKIIIVIGSAHQPRNVRNPWTYEERRTMILTSVPEPERIVVVPQIDMPYAEQKWVRSIQQSVKTITDKHVCEQGYTPSISLVGYAKDRSSYYLKLFPDWENVNIAPATVKGEPKLLNATDLRNKYFDGAAPAEFYLHMDTPGPVFDFLHDFAATEAYKDILAETKYINKYIEDHKFKGARWAPTFVTVDCVVVQSGKVLLIRRKDNPGKGLYAMPGGFLDVEKQERLVDAAIRELKEETKIKVPEPVLRGNIKTSHVFDYPLRSARGRIITHAYLIKLPDQEDMPKVRASSDAKEAVWRNLADLTPQDMFEDHYSIVETMIGYLGED